MKQLCFTLTYQSLQAFRGYYLSYEAHINTNRKLFPRIDFQSAKITNNEFNTNN